MSIKRDTVELRKAMPLASGVLDYFPDALLAVAEVSRVGNEQHHPGQPLHWDKSKSTDEADALLRHLLDRGTRDTDGMRHSAKVAWRALALLQRELDAEAVEEAIVAEEPGTGDGWVFTFDASTKPDVTYVVSGQQGGPYEVAEVESRGVWPPDVRWGGKLMCCGEPEHTLTCPKYR